MLQLPLERFLIIHHLLPIYFLANVIIACGFEAQPGKWGSLNPEERWSLFDDIMKDCDFLTFVPSLRSFLSLDVFMKDPHQGQIL